MLAPGKANGKHFETESKTELTKYVFKGKDISH